MAVVKLIEILAKSPNGWDGAAQEALRETFQTVMSILWPIILIILLIASLGLAIYLVKKLMDLKTKDFLYATLGGLGFAVVWISISLLLDADLSFLIAAAGGIVCFLGFLILGAYRKRADKAPRD